MCRPRVGVSDSESNRELLGSIINQYNIIVACFNNCISSLFNLKNVIYIYFPSFRGDYFSYALFL